MFVRRLRQFKLLHIYSLLSHWRILMSPYGLISVRKLIRKYGGHGGLLTAVKDIIGHPKWTNSCLKLLADEYRWFCIVNIFWRKNENKFRTSTIKTLDDGQSTHFPFGFLDINVVHMDRNLKPIASSSCDSHVPCARSTFPCCSYSMLEQFCKHNLQN